MSLGAAIVILSTGTSTYAAEKNEIDNVDEFIQSISSLYSECLWHSRNVGSGSQFM